MTPHFSSLCSHTAAALASRESVLATAPVLVTGPHRSGTTWIGRMIGSSPEFLYVHEPFNVTSPSPYFLAQCSSWFQYLPPGDDSNIAAAMRALCAYDVEPLARISRIRGLRGRDGAKWQVLHLLQLVRARLMGRRPLVKDPLALFSAPWLHVELGFRPIVTMRHPAAFVGALKRARWHFDFKNLTAQPSLMEDLLGEWASDIHDAARHPPELVPMGSLLWNILHGVIDRFRNEHPDWYFVRHEDIARDPLPGFRSIFDWLGLPMRPEVEARIVDHCTEDAEANGSLVNIKRDSRAQLFTWKQRLSPDEIDFVRRSTERIASLFYSDLDWGEEPVFERPNDVARS